MLQIGETREMLSVSFSAPEREVAPPPTLAQVKQLQDRAQAALSEFPEAAIDVPLEHFFAPGLYTRKCTIPARALVFGKMHRHQHPTFLLSGTCRINTDRGMETITAPYIWTSQEHAKRALVTLTECVFATVHLNPTDTQDLAALEAELIVPEHLIPYETTAIEFADALQEVYA